MTFSVRTGQPSNVIKTQNKFREICVHVMFMFVRRTVALLSALAIYVRLQKARIELISKGTPGIG